jgi:carbohydrate-selective porin OprB
MYYNVAITGWLAVTADLQIINPALKKASNPDGVGLVNVSNATIAGVRARVRF